MQITINIPDELAAQIIPEGLDPARQALKIWPSKRIVRTGLADPSSGVYLEYLPDTSWTDFSRSVACGSSTLWTISGAKVRSLLLCWRNSRKTGPASKSKSMVSYTATHWETSQASADSRWGK
jgi:hypothetical protein